jgi:voltage-gated sodium channel
LFIIEVIIKINEYGYRNYFSENWNKFDFIIVALSIPAFISFVFDLDISSISYLLVFRIMRVFKSFRFIKFIKGIDRLVNGVQRALKASILVLAAFIVYIFIIGIFSFHVFSNTAPEYFSNPMTSLYTIFKIFTVEGWFEIPEQITLNYSATQKTLTYLYFIFILLTGGIFGLSLVNSIFVDAMVSDNNDDLEEKIDNLESKIDDILTKINKNETGKNP